jgi:hypothetical protein
VGQRQESQGHRDRDGLEDLDQEGLGLENQEDPDREVHQDEASSSA